MAVCKCHLYYDLDGNDALIKRHRETKRILTALHLLAEHPGKEHLLYGCSHCGQLWQRSLDWAAGNKPYVFKVPPIEIEAWMQIPFVQPDELFSRIGHVQLYLERASFEEQASKCRFLNCGEQAIKFSVFCAFHHMQNIGIKANIPDKDRWFGPYVKRNYEFGIEQLKALPNYKPLK